MGICQLTGSVGFQWTALCLWVKVQTQSERLDGHYNCYRLLKAWNAPKASFQPQNFLKYQVAVLKHALFHINSCIDSSLKCTKNHLAAGLRLDSLRKLTALPTPPSQLWEKGRGWKNREGKWWEMEGREQGRGGHGGNGHPQTLA